MDLDKNYWDERYLTSETGWDAGKITTPIKDYFDQVTNKELKILIPGSGNGHEAEYLWNKGFHNLFVVDISSLPLENLKKRCPDIPDSHLINANFFDLQEKNFDIVVEQTFFCALTPDLRSDYAIKMADLLRGGGKLVGLLFDDPLNKDKPPFGGNKEEYISYFRPYFEFKYFDKCYNSIPPRAGRELFICLIKKNM